MSSRASIFAAILSLDAVLTPSLRDNDLPRSALEAGRELATGTKGQRVPAGYIYIYIYREREREREI